MVLNAGPQIIRLTGAPCLGDPECQTLNETIGAYVGAVGAYLGHSRTGYWAFKGLEIIDPDLGPNTELRCLSARPGWGRWGWRDLLQRELTSNPMIAAGSLQQGRYKHL